MAHTLQSRTPDLDLLLLECTNLSPFKRDLRQSTRLPVFDLVDALMWTLGSGGPGPLETGGQRKCSTKGFLGWFGPLRSLRVMRALKILCGPGVLPAPQALGG